MSIINAAHAVFPRQVPFRLSDQGSFGTAVFRNVDPEEINPTFAISRFGEDLELVTGEVDGVHFEGVGELGGEDGRYVSLSMRMHVLKASQ